MYLHRVVVCCWALRLPHFPKENLKQKQCYGSEGAQKQKSGNVKNVTRGPVKATCEAISSTSTQPGPPWPVLILFFFLRGGRGRGVVVENIVSARSPRWPTTHNRAGWLWTCRNRPASGSPVLGLQECASVTSLVSLLSCFGCF